MIHGPYCYGMNGPRYEFCSKCDIEIDQDRENAIACDICETVYCETCAPADDLDDPICNDARCLRAYARKLQALLTAPDALSQRVGPDLAELVEQAAADPKRLKVIRLSLGIIQEDCKAKEAAHV